MVSVIITNSNIFEIPYMSTKGFCVKIINKVKYSFSKDSIIFSNEMFFRERSGSKVGG